MRLFRFIIILITASVIAAQALASKQLLLKVVGSVEDKIITNRDVEASYIIDHALYGDGAFSPISYGSDEFAKSLNRLLIELMVRSEATTFGTAKVSDGEVDEAYQTVKNKIQGSSSIKGKWAALDYSDSQLKDMVARKLRSNRFVKYKENSSFVQVGDDEAKDYFVKNRLKFGAMDFDNFKGSIKKYLENKNHEDRLRDWLDLLRRKHKVKNLLVKDVTGGNTDSSTPKK